MTPDLGLGLQGKSLFVHVSMFKLIVASVRASVPSRPRRPGADSLSVGLHSVEVCAAAADSRERPAVMRQAVRIVLDIKKVYEGILVVEVGKSTKVQKTGDERGYGHDSRSI